MSENLILQCNKVSGTTGGVTYTWSSATCRVQGTTGTTLSASQICANTSLSSQPFYPGHTYQLVYSTISGVSIQGYLYPAASGSSDPASNFAYSSSGIYTFTIPSGYQRFLFRLSCTQPNTAYNGTVTVEVYDMTYTDVDADCDMMMSVVGYPNSWFYPKWIQFASAQAWDGESCSEIACCISYMAGNLSKIYVSNYAQGLADLFRANGRFGTTASRGAFMWWDYNGDGVPDHSGRVYEILSDGTIHTVEGNVGGLVVERYYSQNDPTIYGYGYPNYDNDPATDPGDPTPPKFIFVPYWRHQRRGR